MYGCSHGCPLVAQLVDTFQAMSIEIDNVRFIFIVSLLND